MSQHTYSKLSRDCVKANMDGVFEIRRQGNFWTFLLLVSWEEQQTKEMRHNGEEIFCPL